MIKQFTVGHKERRVNRFKININPKPGVLCYFILWPVDSITI